LSCATTRDSEKALFGFEAKRQTTLSAIKDNSYRYIALVITIKKKWMKKKIRHKKKRSLRREQLLQ